jgi:hypothetical protein
MAETKRETKRGGFHSLEKTIHDLEEADRALERKPGARRSTEVEEPEVTSEIRPPSAHEE